MNYSIRQLVQSLVIVALATTAAIVERGELEVYAAMDQRGELKLRVLASLWWDRERDEEQIPDLIVLDQNLLDIESIAISDTKVLLTLLEREAVHGSIEDL